MANNVLKVPPSVISKFDELYELCEKEPVYLKTASVAQFLGMDPAGLRCSIERGRCPFGIYWQKDARGNKAFKIPTATFYLWFTCGAVINVTGTNSNLEELKKKSEIFIRDDDIQFIKDSSNLAVQLSESEKEYFAVKFSKDYKLGSTPLDYKDGDIVIARKQKTALKGDDIIFSVAASGPYFECFDGNEIPPEDLKEHKIEYLGVIFEFRRLYY